MNQKRTALLVITFIIVAVLALGGIWYWRSQKGKTEIGNVEISEEKQPQKIDTSTWLPYVVGYIQFRYPANWKIEEHEVTLGRIEQKNHFGVITQTVLAETQETVREITLIPPTQQSEKDIIKIGGRVRNCKDIDADYKCEEKVGIPVYTASESDGVLNTFHSLVDTFDIYFQVVDSNTGIAIEDVKIRAVVFPDMTNEEFIEKYIRNCPPTRRTDCAPGRCYSCLDVPETEGKFFTKQEFKKFINEGPLGIYNFTVESEGYSEVSTYFMKSKELRRFGGVVLMSPSSAALGKSREDVPELGEEYIRSLLRPGTVLVIGFVVDDVLRKPLAGVTVSIPKLNLATKTNTRGFYFLNVPEYPGSIDTCEELIATALTYTYSKDGFKTFEVGENYPVNSKGEVREPHYIRINATLFYGTGRIIHEYVPPGGCRLEPTGH